jgi:CHAT domain-containing protein/tetratricopeptide (TPR) repeat protein
MTKASRRATLPSFLLALSLVLAAAAPLSAKTLSVPADFPTIKSAVHGAEEGDLILVDDGVYLETNIVVDKAVRIRARHPYGAVIYGSMKGDDFVFEIRAAAEIEGFLFKGGKRCLIQRRSPDVPWKARDLAIFDFEESIAVNAVEGNLGSAEIEGVLISGSDTLFRTSTAISTNDANRVDVHRSFVMNRNAALGGYNHIAFRVADSVILGCDVCVTESTRYQPIPPATSAVELDAVRVLAFESLKDPGQLRLVQAGLEAALGTSGRPAVPPAEDGARRALGAFVRGEIFASMGRPVDSERLFNEALAAAKNARSNELTWMALLDLGRLHETRGRPDEAMDSYREAIGLVDRWLPRVPAGLFRVNFMEDKTVAYESLIRLLLDGDGENPDGPSAAEAFRTAEKLRSLASLRISAMSGRPFAADAEAVTARKQAGRRISALQTELQNSALTAEKKEALCAELERAEEEWNALLLSTRRMSWNSRPVEAQRVLDAGRLPEGLSGRLVLSYLLGEEESYAFLAGEKGIAAARLPARATIEAMVDNYLKFLRLEGTTRFQGWKGGEILHDILLGPFQEEIGAGAREIVIIPSGHLHYLPFEALVVGPRENGPGGRFWGENRTVVYAPSLRAALPAEGGGKGGSERPILGVGYSGAARCDNRTRNLKQIFLPLSHVKREVREVTEYFPASEVRTLLGREASEARLKQMDLAEFGIVHIATHGIIDDVHWWRSALLLEPDARIPEDGLLTAMEIPDLDLDAGLVVLSACGTGLGGVYRGEGIRGLAGAFRAAGADNIVVSLWNVDDEAAAVFMKYFYRFLTEGKSPAVALRETKLRMIGSKYASPRFWAPFVLIGKAELIPGRKSPTAR